MLIFFLLPILLRLCLLPSSPAPVASGADDFSYLLLGDTLRHFRLANPPHPLSQFVETTFVLQHPTYSSIFPLGQGFVLAAGWLCARSFWVGVLCSGGAFCALCYWMLRAWTVPVWAFVGGMLAVIQFGALNPWMNSYWGGYVSASAGCLAFGALPKLRGNPDWKNGALLGLGLGLQILSRPFESLALSMAAVAYLLFSFWRELRTAWKPCAAAAIPIGMALSLTLLQNQAVTRQWTTLPYMLSRYQYGVPTTFTFQRNPMPHLALSPQQNLDYAAQASIHGNEAESVTSYLKRLADRIRYLRFFALPPLYVAIVAFIVNLRRRRGVWIAGTILLFALGSNFYPYFFPHYIAAVTCLMVLVIVTGLERLPGGMRGAVLRTSFACFAFWFSVYLTGSEKVLPLLDYQSWDYLNFGDPQGRAAVEKELGQSLGQQLVFVSYLPSHRFQEWVHNDADIDNAKVIMSNDLGPIENRKLLDFYPTRTAWMLYPDAHPVSLLPYPKTSELFQTVR